MRHGIRRGKLNKTTPHRLAMLANMASSLIKYEQIKTTLPKAKILRPFLERLVTDARSNNLSVRRRIISKIRDLDAAKRLIDVIAPRYSKRPGGYLRIVKAGFRVGDMAPVAYIEFVDREKGLKPSGESIKKEENQVSE